MPQDRPRKVLVAYSKLASFTPTTLEYLLALKRHSSFEVSYVHCTRDAIIDIDFNEYDVLFHNYCARLSLDGYVSKEYERSLTRFRGLKILSVQDDYERTDVLHQAIRRLGFHIVITCIQREFWPLVYPESEVPGVHFAQGLTGYMPEAWMETKQEIVPLEERPIEVAYRGRDLGAKYGRLGFEKYEIGRRMAELCAEKGIVHDIAMDDASRIYGDAWSKFIGSSRTMLGSESGSNTFDFDGSLERAITAFAAENGRKPSYADLKHILDPMEAPFNVGQISPRVFECAVMMTPMILFRGDYSGAMVPDVHYICLEKDFSNAEEILNRIKDTEYLGGFAERAYRDLVSSGRYGYKNFVDEVAKLIEDNYHKVVDRRWVEYREKVSAILPGNPRMQFDDEEKVRRKYLLENVTEFPLYDSGHEEAMRSLKNEKTQRKVERTQREREERLANAVEARRKAKEARNARITLSVSRENVFVRAASRMWRMLPRSVRGRIRGELR